MEILAAPDFGVIFLRVAAFTAIATALYLTTGFSRGAHASGAISPQSKVHSGVLVVTLLFGIFVIRQLSSLQTTIAAVREHSASIDDHLDDLNRNLQEIQTTVSDIQDDVATRELH